MKPANQSALPHRILIQVLGWALVMIIASSASVANGNPGSNLAQSSDPLAQAQALIDRGDGAGALEVLRPLLKKDPKNGAARLASSTALFLIGDFDSAERDLAQALRIDPRLRQGWLNLGALRLSEGDGSSALEAFQKARALDPEASDNALNIGTVQLMLGNLAEAQGEFAGYLGTVGNSAEANALIAKNYALANVLESATAHATTAIEKDERQRLAMRTDPAFSLALDHPPFQALLAKDSFRPARGSLTATHIVQAPFETRRVAGALIDALNSLQIPFDPRVEATANWALVWGDKIRIKVAPASSTETQVILVAAPRSHTRTAWESLQQRLFEQISYQLAPKLPLAARGRG